MCNINKSAVPGLAGVISRPETSSKVRISVIAQVLVQESQGRPDSWL